MNDFTKGEWVLDENGNIKCSNQHRQLKILSLSGVSLAMYDNAEIEANTRLVFTTFTTATKLAEYGYDAVKVLQLLPTIVELFSDNTRSTDELGFIIEKLLAESKS